MEQSEILAAYYAKPAVRTRVAEFMGGSTFEDATAKYVAASDFQSFRPGLRPTREAGLCLDQGAEISRSLWDRSALLADLDIEYVNFDFPGEAYLRPERVFALQQPAVEATEEILRGFGISPLHTLSGRGHHFIWQVSMDSKAFDRLMELGCGPQSSSAPNLDLEGYGDEPVPVWLAGAFMGLSLAMEYLAHLIKERSAHQSKIPVEFTAVETGPSGCGREMLSIDLSEYGDPLQSRGVRVPFGAYLKPWQQREMVGDEIIRNLPLLVSVPMQDGLDETLAAMRDLEKAAVLAETARTRIPEQSPGMEALLNGYGGSSLRSFHDFFYSTRHEPEESWPSTYDRVPLDILPGCVRHALVHPNDLLLKPHGMRLLTRTLLALGWHPRHIAGLIRSKFDRDFQWNDQWKGYSPGMRADFYTRIFSGLFATGRDDLIDFNCQSSQEERTCSIPDCRWNLETFRQSALDRRKYGYLAHRPFNRLFLPKEHF